MYGKPSMTCFKYQVYILYQCTCTVQTPSHECYTFSGYRKLFYVFITLFLECFVNCTGHSNLFLYRSCIALFYRKRLPQQQRDR
jgi:hypothetical protein